MRRAVNHAATIGGKVTARCPALARTDQLQAGLPIFNVHRENLIALVRLPSGLEDQLFSVRRKVGFGILTAGRQLADVSNVSLTGMRLQPSSLRQEQRGGRGGKKQ